MKKHLRKTWRIVVIIVGVFIIFSSLLASLENILIGNFTMAIASIFWAILVGILIYNFATGKKVFCNILKKEISFKKKSK